MKFKQFEFRLFPRIRNKKKKKQKFTNADFPRDLSLDKNCNYSGPCYYNNSGFEHNFPPYFANKTYISNGYYGNCDNDCFYSCYQSFPFPELTIKVDANYDCESCSGSNPVLKYDVSPHSCVNPLSVEPESPIGTPHTVPRTRTRIKTNPWLPSPRETPNSSPTGTTKSLLISPETFPASPLATDNPLLTVQCANCHSLVSINEVEDTVDNDPEAPVKKPDEPCNYCVITADHEKRHSNSRSACISYDTLNGTYNTAEVGASVTNGRVTLPYVRHSIYDNNRLSFTDFLKYDSESSKCSTPVIGNKENIGNLTYDIEYEYEDEVNNLLENQGIPKDSTFLSIKELMDDEYQYDMRMDHSTSEDITHLSEYDKTDCNTCGAEQMNEKLHQNTPSADGLGDSSSDDVHHSEESIGGGCSNDRSSRTHSSHYDEGCMHESTDTGYASHAPESDIFTDTDSNTEEEFESIEEENELEWDNDPTAHNLQCNGRPRRPLCYSMSDRSRLGAPRREIRPRSKSLADIELSLEDKVTQLREEKLFVQKKILEAKEEEIIRRQQLLKFKSVSSSNRKEVLLRTLRGLKTRLENQSVRLQTSYDTVLSLNKRLSQRRGAMKLLETNL